MSLNITDKTSFLCKITYCQDFIYFNLVITSSECSGACSLFIKRASFYRMNMHNASRTLSRSAVLFPFQHDSRIISKRDRIRIRDPDGDGDKRKRRR